jgi:hypothetical protein
MDVQVELLRLRRIGEDSIPNFKSRKAKLVVPALVVPGYWDRVWPEV